MNRIILSLFLIVISNSPVFSQIKKSVLELSTPRSGMGVSVYGGKIICAGGGVRIDTNPDLEFTRLIDIIDSKTLEMTQLDMKSTKMRPNVINWRNKVLFTKNSNFQITNKEIDIYNFEDISWSSITTKNEYNNAILLGDKVYFYNGQKLASITGTLDIYDLIKESWTNLTFPEPRVSMIVYNFNQKLFFIGGNSIASTPNNMSNRVDIFDTQTNEWSQGGNLVNGRNIGTSDHTFIGSKIIFADGEIYDMALAKSIAKPESSFFTYSSAVALDSLAFFTGGYSYASGSLKTSDTIRIYNANTDTWSYSRLSESRTKISAVKILNNVVFVGGYSNNGASARVDIYNAFTKRWSIENLDTGRYNVKTAVLGNKLFLIDGDFAPLTAPLTNNYFNFSFEPSKYIDVFEFTEDVIPTTFVPDLEIYPNPFHSELNFRWLPRTDEIGQLKIFNTIGQNVYTKTIQNGQKILDFEYLSAGTYIIYLETIKGILTKKIVKY